MTGKEGSSNTSSVVVQNFQDAPFPSGVILDDNNYPLWSQVMEMRIGARNKLGFLTGTSAKPTTNDTLIEAWVTDNNKVKSWLIDSMNPTLMRRFIRLKTSAEIWSAVSKTFYDGTDETQLFELNRRSFSTRQNGRPLPTYYNELISIYQEIDTRMVNESESVEITVAVNKAISRFRVHIFLSGLDSEFNQVRSEALRKDPALDLEACYAYIRKDQSQRNTMETPAITEPDSVVNIATRNRNFKQKEKSGNNFSCTHCGETGHSKLRCYEIIGYPDWWDFSKKPRKKLGAGQAAIASTPQTSEDLPFAAHTSSQPGHGDTQDSWLWY